MTTEYAHTQANDHSHILTQLAAGDITAAEAAERLRGRGRTAQPAAAGQWLRIRVTNLHTGRQKVSVNLPLSWVRLGMQIGSRFAPEVGQIHLNDLLAALQSGASGRLVDVEDYEDGERVEIFVE